MTKKKSPAQLDAEVAAYLGQTLDSKRALHAVKQEIKAFERQLAAQGGGYRGPSGTYDDKLYQEHNRLVGRKQDLERSIKIQ